MKSEVKSSASEGWGFPAPHAASVNFKSIWQFFEKF